MSSVFEDSQEDLMHGTIIGEEYQTFWMPYDFTLLWLYKQTLTVPSHTEKINLKRRGNH